jgi:hypothetical protein
MNLGRRFFEEVAVAYLVDAAIGASAAIGGWLFKDAILSVISAYRYTLYIEYWYVVIAGIAISFIQAFLLVKFRTITAYIWSTAFFLVLWIIYASMLFPPTKPLIPEVHTLWRFVFHVALMFQFGAIMIVGGVSFILYARRKIRVTP